MSILCATEVCLCSNLLLIVWAVGVYCCSPTLSLQQGEVLLCLHPGSAMRELQGSSCSSWKHMRGNPIPFIPSFKHLHLNSASHCEIQSTKTIAAVGKGWKLPAEIVPRNCIHSVPKTPAWLRSNRALHWATPGKHTLHVSKEYFV